MTAIYLKNRSPTAAVPDGTPEELWSGRKVDFNHLRVFGCRAYALVPVQNRRKLDSKSREYIFVGYCENSKGYRLSDPCNPCKVILSRNVHFIEMNINNSLNCDNHEKICDSSDKKNEFNLMKNVYVNSGNNECYCYVPGMEPSSGQAPSESAASPVTASEQQQPDVCDSSHDQLSSDLDFESMSEASYSDSLEVDTSAVVPVAEPPPLQRPVRSTRSTAPKRFQNYDLSLFSQSVFFS